MEQIDARIRKWGNSYGVVLPIRVIERQNLEEGEDVSITIQSKKKMMVKDLMSLSRKLGLDKKLKNVDTQKALREVDEAFWSEE